MTTIRAMLGSPDSSRTNLYLLQLSDLLTECSNLRPQEDWLQSWATLLNELNYHTFDSQTNVATLMRALQVRTNLFSQDNCILKVISSASMKKTTQREVVQNALGKVDEHLTVDRSAVQQRISEV